MLCYIIGHTARDTASQVGDMHKYKDIQDIARSSMLSHVPPIINVVNSDGRSMRVTCLALFERTDRPFSRRGDTATVRNAEGYPIGFHRRFDPSARKSGDLKFRQPLIPTGWEALKSRHADPGS